MVKALKIGLLVVGALVVVTLLTLRVTGLEPAYVDPSSEEFVKSGRTTRPGLWLTGEVVHEPVTNWDWVNKVNDPIRKNTIVLETRTWYGIPHSVTINIIGRGDKLYVQGSERDFRLQKKFPYSKAWWANVERDPRVRMKIGGKIYEMTLVLIHDRAEVAQLQRGRDPVTKEIGADGKNTSHRWRTGGAFTSETFRNMGTVRRLRHPIRRIHKKGAPVAKPRLNTRPSVPNSHARQRTKENVVRRVDVEVYDSVLAFQEGRATPQRYVQCPQ